MRHDRYRRAELQAAYEAGYQQMQDHEAAGFRERTELMAEHVAPNARSQAVAAAHEGAADALRSLAAQWRENAKVERLGW
jgi:hypothetical protein